MPTDTVKYEMDKDTGILRMDRPQQYSNVCPSLYGFMPQTLCGDRVAALCMERTGRRGIVGDGDPMDICVLTEREIPHGDILVEAMPIGGLRMIDGDEADDKIVAVLRERRRLRRVRATSRRCRGRCSTACATTSSPTSRRPTA